MQRRPADLCSRGNTETVSRYLLHVFAEASPTLTVAAACRDPLADLCPAGQTEYREPHTALIDPHVFSSTIVCCTVFSPVNKYACISSCCVKHTKDHV